MLFDYYLFVTFCTDERFWKRYIEIENNLATLGFSSNLRVARLLSISMKRYQESVAKSVSLIIIVILLTCCIVLAWNIVGSIWVYGASTDDDDSEENYCNYTAYTLAYTMGTGHRVPYDYGYQMPNF